MFEPAGSRFFLTRHLLSYGEPYNAAPEVGADIVGIMYLSESQTVISLHGRKSAPSLVQRLEFGACESWDIEIYGYAKRKIHTQIQYDHPERTC